MKNTKSLLILSMVAALCGCQIEEKFEPVGSDLIALKIDGGIAKIESKASAAGFADGDGLGLYAVNYTDGNAVAGSLLSQGNQADNVKYIFSASANTWTPVRPVYYKDVNTHVDLYVYYPHQSKIEDVNAFNFEVKQDQSAPAEGSSLSGYESSDLMWCKTSDIAPTESTVRVLLAHKLAGISVTLQKGTGFADGEYEIMSKSVLLNGTTRKATVDFATGSVTPLGAAQATGIVMEPQADGTFRAVAIPQTLAAGTGLFSITLGGQSYSYSRTVPTEYVSGKMSQFTLTLNKKVPTGEVEIVMDDITITDWVNDRNPQNSENVRQYYVVNVPKPGYLGRTIKADKKNPNKIKNLKVMGTVNNADFYFMRDSMAILEAINMKEAILDCADIDKYTPSSYLYLDNYSQDYIESYIEEHGEPSIVSWDHCAYWYPDESKGQIIPSQALSRKASLYYFEFPERVTEIGPYAFYETKISGALSIPEDVKTIGRDAFGQCGLLTSLSLSNRIELICNGAFEGCRSLSGSLLLPNSLLEIEPGAFQLCKFTGALVLPDHLKIIGDNAFSNTTFTGDLVIPESVKTIGQYAFSQTPFGGRLDLANVEEIGRNAFEDCQFQGELVIPEGVKTIPTSVFNRTTFSSVRLPSSLKSIDSWAFRSCPKLTGELIFPEGFMAVGDEAFAGSRVTKIEFSSTILSIGSKAFNNCVNVSSMICRSVQAPNVLSGAFNGIPKDSFTLEVPASSVTRYQAASGWGDFRRIGAHYDFSLSRNLMRGLNAEISNTYILRAPAGYDWSIESKPDWVTVTPSSGTGKTEVTVTFSQMARTNDVMYDLDNVYQSIGKGRNGEVVFLLDGKDYRSTMVVEQYDSDYQDGQAVTIESHSEGQGIDIVYIGDGYDARDIATGKFLQDVNAGNSAFFGVEPYTTYKDYFDVKAVVSMSPDSGIGTVNTVVETKFGSYFTQNRILAPNASACFNWAARAKSGIDFTKSLVIMLQNASVYEGVTLMYGDGSAIACCPISADAYPYDFRGIIQHEAGGHGFGKLADEYIYHAAFIQTCGCLCCDHPQSDSDVLSALGYFKSLGWYRNLSMESDMHSVPWAHLIFHERYSDYVDMYEGGYMHSRGMYRSEATSCMNNNIPHYSAISRQAIVERIMECAGETFSFDSFVAKDSNAFGAKTMGSVKTMSSQYPVELAPDYREHTYPIFMGEHPAL